MGQREKKLAYADKKYVGKTLITSLILTPCTPNLTSFHQYHPGQDVTKIDLY